MRPAMSVISSSSLNSVQSTTNSSPPRRAAVSECREKRESRRESVQKGKSVHETGHRIVQHLVRQSVLRLDLRSDITSNPERADNLSTLIAKRHLAGRRPGIGSVDKRLALEFPHDRFTVTNDLALILKGCCGVFLAVEVEVRFTDQFVQCVT